MTIAPIDSRKLRYFAAVVENGSFARAAAALHVTQPALSTAIKKLEEHFGLTLLDRDVKPIAPTIFGEAVYRSALSFASEGVRLQRELRDVADLNNGSVSVVLGATFPINYVLRTYETIRQTFPGFALSLTMGGYTSSLDPLLRGECDLIFSQLPNNRSDARVTHKEVLLDRFEVICSHAHPLSGRANLTLTDLIDYPWIGGGPFDAFLPGWTQRFQEHGLRAPKTAINTLTIPVTEMALRNHNYLAILPVKCVERELRSGELVALPVPQLRWPQVKGISWAAERSLPPSVRLFLKTFDKIIRST